MTAQFFFCSASAITNFSPENVGRGNGEERPPRSTPHPPLDPRIDWEWPRRIAERKRFTRIWSSWSPPRRTEKGDEQ